MFADAHKGDASRVFSQSEGSTETEVKNIPVLISVLFFSLFLLIPSRRYRSLT